MTTNQALDQRHLDAIRFAKDAINASAFLPFIRKILLFGSCVRNEARFDSDVDILIVIRDEARRFMDFKHESMKLRSYFLEQEDLGAVQIDIKIYTQNDWDANDSFFLQTVHREGREI